MKIAAEEAQQSGAPLALLNQILTMYQTLEKEGQGDKGTQALIKYYENK